MLQLRQTVLAVALAATVAASFFDFSTLQTEPETVVNVAPVVVVKSLPPKPSASAAAVSAPLHARFAPGEANLFASRSWQPPPPPPPKAAAPSAPALPFSYLGKVQEGGRITVFLAQGARTHVLKKGDTLPGYKVDDITMAEIIFVYLPLNEKQKLMIGSAN